MNAAETRNRVFLYTRNAAKTTQLKSKITKVLPIIRKWCVSGSFLLDGQGVDNKSLQKYIGVLDYKWHGETEFNRCILVALT